MVNIKHFRTFIMKWANCYKVQERELYMYRVIYIACYCCDFMPMSDHSSVHAYYIAL